MCAFYANANVKPTPPSEIIPYEVGKVEKVSYEEFVADYNRIRRGG